MACLIIRIFKIFGRFVVPVNLGERVIDKMIHYEKFSQTSFGDQQGWTIVYEITIGGKTLKHKIKTENDVIEKNIVEKPFFVFVLIENPKKSMPALKPILEKYAL